MKTLNAIINVVEFLWEAVNAYAETPKGQEHINKVAADLQIDQGQPGVQVGDVNYPASYADNQQGPRIVRNS